MGAMEVISGETPEFARKVHARIQAIREIAENPNEVVEITVAGGNSYRDYCKNYEEALAHYPGAKILIGKSELDGGMTWFLQVPKQGA